MSIWNIVQEQQMGKMRRDSQDVKQTSEVMRKQAENIVISFERRIDMLSLVCQSMWSLLEERTGLTERDLAKRITELDLRDGQLDGRATKPPVECPSCDSMISRKFNRCLFCGYENPDTSPFDYA